jgi:hypothetical protein
MSDLKLIEVLRTVLDALYNVPIVGEKYDQQHSDTHMRAAIDLKVAITELEEE